MSGARRDPFGLCGTVIDGKYRVVEAVGEGGFGVVYRGVHEGFDSPVAIKCLKLPPHFDEAAQAALVVGLRDEGRLLRKLSQRTSTIVQAHDVGTLTTQLGARVPYLVLEWLDGNTLADELRTRGRGMPLDEAQRMLEPAARALALAHEQNVAHRDVKPENLFLVEGRTPKILDFGIAKVFADAPSAVDAVTGAGPSAFTPAYGAPEQFDKRRGATGPWTDVYALALVLVEMVSGKRAQVGDDFASLLSVSTDPDRRPTLRSVGIAAPPAVERVLERALAIEPRRRFADAGSFWTALQSALVEDAALGTAGTQLAPPSDANLSTGEFLAERGLAEKLTEVSTAPTEIAPPGPATGGGSPATTRGGVSATAPTPPGRSPAPFLAAAAAVIGIGALVWHFALRDRAGSVGQVPSASAVVAADAAPRKPEAQRLFDDARQSWFDGTIDGAVRKMEEAVAADPAFGAAELRLALWKFEKKPPDAREHFEAAFLHRASLGAKDRALLEASEPYLREPWNLEEWTNRMEKLVREHPNDAELLAWLGLSNHVRLRFDAAIEAFDRALAQNPGFVGAWVLKADTLSLEGDPAAQLAAYEACLKMAPMAMQCLSRQVVVRGRMGQCEAMRDDAKRLLTLSPKSASTQRQLAVALFATGAPRDAVAEALARSAALVPDDERAAREGADRSAVAWLAGDFAGVEAAVKQWQAAVKDKTSQNAHAEPALELASLYEQMGDSKRAGQEADAFVRRMDALSEPHSGDWTMAFLPHRLRAGLVSKEGYALERDAWVHRIRAKWRNAGRRLDQELQWITWLNAHGSAVRTAEQAREALAAMPSTPFDAIESGRWTPMDLAVGRVQALAGDPALAVAPLRRAARSCLGLTEPTIPAPVHLYLGMALEKTKDPVGARAAYEKVLSLWGKAKPRSVVADQAKARLAALPH